MANVATGAKARVGFASDLGGFIPLAYAASINITHENKLEEIPQLDSLEVAEYAENGHRVSFTVNFFKLLPNFSDRVSDTYEDARSYDLDYERLDQLLIQPEMIFQIVSDERRVNAQTGQLEEFTTVLYEIRGVKFEGGSGSMDARGLWAGTWSFRGRRGVGI